MTDTERHIRFKVLTAASSIDFRRMVTVRFKNQIVKKEMQIEVVAGEQNLIAKSFSLKKTSLEFLVQLSEAVAVGCTMSCILELGLELCNIKKYICHGCEWLHREHKLDAYRCVSRLRLLSARECKQYIYLHWYS